MSNDPPTVEELIKRKLHVDDVCKSKTYRSRQKTLITIYSRTEGRFPQYNKKVDIFEGKTRDVDVIALENTFGPRKQAEQIETDILQDTTFDDYIDYLRKKDEDKDLTAYDTFLFVFLTYAKNHTTDSVWFSDREAVPFDEVLTKVKTIPSLVAKPKLFLVQADLPGIKSTLQAGLGSTEPITRVVRLPTDSDVLVVRSQLPAFETRPNESDKDLLADPPTSLLIQAFCEALEHNWTLTSEDRLDFLSLTVNINWRVREKCERYERLRNLVYLTVRQPLVYSTLRQLVYL